MGLDYKSSIMYGYKYDTYISTYKDHEFDFHEDTEDPMSREILTYLNTLGCSLYLINNDSSVTEYILYHNSTYRSWDPICEDPGVERIDTIPKGDAINADLQACRDFLYTYGLSTAKGGGKLSWWFIGEVY